MSHQAMQNNLDKKVSDDFRGNAELIEMSRYIDLEIYHAVERSHPYYIEMVEEISSKIASLAAEKKCRVLEFGAGTGLATGEILGLPNLDVVALELDAECAAILTREVADTAQVVTGNILSYQALEPFDAIFSVFAHDHIHHDDAPRLVANLRRNLKRGGLYLMGGEILPFYENNEERSEALYRYHGFIIEKALRDGHFELAQIEISALKSGIQKIGDFKRHEALFETEMLVGDFRLLEKIKHGPEHLDDVGGVYTYVFEAI